MYISYEKLMIEKPELFQNNNENKTIKILPIESVPKNDSTKYGILYSDQYFTLLRDYVQFPNGEKGGYLRLLSQIDYNIAVLLICNHKILLVKHYRHAIQKSIWEVPRGFGDSIHSPEQKAIEEVYEETNLHIQNLSYLGTLYQDTGIQNGSTKIYIAEYNEESFHLHLNDQKESISEYGLFSESEIEEMILTGDIQDGFTLGALSFAFFNNKFMIHDKGQKYRQLDEKF